MAGDEAEAEPTGTEAPLRSAATFAFLGSGCLLVLEIVAGRLVAPTLGVSLYTWTSIIGVVIGGVSLGNYLGGRLADRWPTRSTLSLVYLAAVAASLIMLGLVHSITSLELPSSAPAFLQVLWLTTVLFFVPSTILGAPTPVLSRMSLQSVDHTGRVVGRIQAAASLGSVVGAFLTGFLLIPVVGVRLIVVGVAAVLFALALVAHPWWRRRRAYELGSLAAVIVTAGALSVGSHGGCVKESAYYCIKVLESTDHTQRELILDHLVDSQVNLADPSVPVYEYEKLYAQVIDFNFPHDLPLDAFQIGGGGYTFPRYLDKNFQASTLVAEIDPGVTDVARTYLRFRDTLGIEIVHDDARRVLRSLPSSRTFDLVLGDAFNDYEVPYQLTTREFHRLVAAHLKPGGLYLLNVIDGVNFDFLRSEIRTLRQTFPYVALVAVPGTLPPGNHDRSTFVVVAGKRAPRGLEPTIPASTLSEFMAYGDSVVLTDDHAPVDQLLAPVFSQALTTGR